MIVRLDNPVRQLMQHELQIRLPVSCIVLCPKVNNHAILRCTSVSFGHKQERQGTFTLKV
jgi:hypothetical protein